MNRENGDGDGDENPGMRLSTFWRDQEPGMGRNADEEEHQQELQLRLQPQSTEKERQVEIGVPSKRILNMNKCERCRMDKKKVRCLSIFIITYMNAASGITTCVYHYISPRSIQTDTNNGETVSSRGSSLASKV